MDEPSTAGSADLLAVLTCPHCGRRSQERMPEDACLFFWECPGCGALLRPRGGDCCVFCSWGDRPCPPVAAARAGRPGGCGCGPGG